MLLSIIVYIYTVLAFNLFSKTDILYITAGVNSDVVEYYCVHLHCTSIYSVKLVYCILQLVLTVMLLSIIVYIYTVLQFIQ